jgi:three-Cys-motif partner protein
MQIAGQLGTIDMFLNFPIMDMNRNTLLWKPELADPDHVARMTRFWGDESWKQIAWVESQPDMFGDTEQQKQPNKVIAEAFRERLKKVAGFAYVPEPLPMTNKKNAVIYYLFFAAKHPAAANIIEGIFRQARKGAYRNRNGAAPSAAEEP